MRKTPILLSLLLIASMLLMACAPEETETVVPQTEVMPTEEPMTEAPVTEEPTEEPMVTETVEPAAEQPTEQGIPVTGAENPSLLSNQLDYDVWSGPNDQIGEIENMIIDLGTSRIPYVHIETGGFLDIGDTSSLVPWNALRLSLNTDPDPITSDDNVFVLQVDQNLLADSPSFDPTTLPAAGEPADDWDAGFNDFWDDAGVEGFEPADGTAVTEMQGVIMATDLLASTVVFDSDVDLTGLDVGDQMSIDNVVVDTSTGQLQFIVLNAPFADQNRLIPVPLNQFRWDAALDAFVYTGDPAMLQGAPFFESGYPDWAEEGWVDPYFGYWP